MKKLNVWLVSAYDQPKGMSSRTYDFAKELVKRGHQVTMFSNGYCHWTHKEYLHANEKKRIEYIDGIRVIWLKTIPYKGNGAGRALNMFSNAFRCISASKCISDTPDVVLGPSVPLLTGWAASYIAKKKKCAFVFEVRDFWPLSLVYNGALSRHHPMYYYFRFLEKRLYKKANSISSVLPRLSQHVADSGADPSLVSWVPNGVDLSRFVSFANYDGGNSDLLTIMYIGGLSAGHGVATIIEAAKVLQDKNSKAFRFVIIGNGPQKAYYEQLAQSYSLQNLEFRPAIPKSEIPSVQQEADILVASVLSVDTYKFGVNFNKLYDYFASARPVVLSCCSANDPVQDSGGGYSVGSEDPEKLVEAFEAIKVMSALERIRLGMKGRAYVEEFFDIKQVSLNFERVLMNAIENKQGGYNGTRRKKIKGN